MRNAKVVGSLSKFEHIFLINQELKPLAQSLLIDNTTSDRRQPASYVRDLLTRTDI